VSQYGKMSTSFSNEIISSSDIHTCNMFSQKTVFNFDTRPQTLANINYVCDDVEVLWQQVFENEVRFYAFREECIGRLENSMT